MWVTKYKYELSGFNLWQPEDERSDSNFAAKCRDLQVSRAVCGIPSSGPEGSVWTSVGEA